MGLSLPHGKIIANNHGNPISWGVTWYLDKILERGFLDHLHAYLGLL
jgi:hypothetical protein